MPKNKVRKPCYFLTYFTDTWFRVDDNNSRAIKICDRRKVDFDKDLRYIEIATFILILTGIIACVVRWIL